VPGSPSGHPPDYDPDTEERTELKRAITPGLLLLFIVGDIVGGGIYSLVGEVGGEVGGAIWVPFLVALVMALFTAGSYAELVSKYPRAGGAALYVKKAFNSKFLAFIVAFAVMASGVTSAATLSRGFAGDYLPTFLPDLKVLIGALLALLLVTVINLRGIAESVKLNVGFTLVELTGLLIIVVIGVVALTDGSGDIGQAFEFKSGGSPVGLALAGAALAFYALIGFEDSVNVAEETQNPRSTFPGTLFKGIAIAGVVYLLVTIAFSTVVPAGDIDGGALLDVVKLGPLDIPLEVFSAIGLLALINGALINMIMASRLLYGMSEEKVLPPVFGRVLPGRRTPWVGILFTSLLCAILIIIGSLDTLASTTVTLLTTVFIFVNASVLVLRRQPVEHDHFQVPSVVPVIGILISIALLTQQEAKTFGIAAILVAVGAVLWAVNEAFERSRGGRERGAS
jgi:basic amino acid/polyamine antiporter, APA family